MELSVFNQKLEGLQDLLIENASDENQIYGDGKNLVNNEVFRIESDFADQLYMRKMYMPKESVVVSAMHHTEQFWFLLKGRILVTTQGEQVEHIAPCYEKSLKGAKRFIIGLEDSLFINIHKNPTNTRNVKELENQLVSINQEEYEKYVQTKNN